MLFISTISMAQELVKPVLPEVDSTSIKETFELGKPVSFSEFLNGRFLNSLSENQFKLDIPDFDSFLKSRWVITRSDLSGYGTPDQGIFTNDITGFSPFFSSGSVFNQATYRISDKLTIGGASFGARSLFSAPLPGNLTKPFDTRGTTLFFRYKVSPNFKIETRVSVTQGPGM